MLELALRNRIHAVMTDARHENWFRDDGVLLGEWQPDQLAKAIANIEAERKTATPSRVVAALTFSFWTAMFGKDYETLWQQTLHRLGRRQDGKGLRRKDFSAPLTTIRSLRNRVAHHEPIIMWNLPQRHDSILKLTEWLSPTAAEWCRVHCRFTRVYPPERIALHQRADPQQPAGGTDELR